MLPHTYKLSEKQIISMLQENHSLAWKSLYDEYAPALYGIICELTENKLLADQIFMNAFIQLKEQDILSKIKHSLFSFLIKHTYSYATNYLIQSGITPVTLKLFKESPRIHLQNSLPVSTDSVLVTAFSKRN